MNDLFKLPFWRKHGLSLLFIGVALLVLGLAFWVHNNAEQALLMSKMSYQQQQSINLEAEQSAAILATHLISYRALQEQGIIGKPQRLQWLEALRTNVDHNLIPVVNFTLSPTAVASETNTTYKSETLTLKITPMRVEFKLLHEGDFYRLLAEMRLQSKGLFSAQNCEIQHTERESAEANDSVNSYLEVSFKGQCELLWYSLADVTSHWDVPQ